MEDKFQRTLETLEHILSAFHLEHNRELSREEFLQKFMEDFLRQPLGVGKIFVYVLQSDETDWGNMVFMFDCGDTAGKNTDKPLPPKELIQLRENESLTTLENELADFWVLVEEHIIIGYNGMGMVEPSQKKALVEASNIVYLALLHRHQLRLVEKEAITDALTGVRRQGQELEMLMSEMSKARREAEAADIFVVAFADFDGLKKANDKYGQAAGDLLLTRNTQVMLETAGLKRDEMARVGGDEFVFCLRDSAILSQICQAVAQPFEYGRIKIETGVSIGFVEVSIPRLNRLRRESDAKMLIDLAEQGKRASKTKGGGVATEISFG